MMRERREGAPPPCLARDSEAMIAGMLGARQSDLVAALQALARLGLIRYGEDRVEVLDRAGLEAHACECYRVVKQEFERLPPRG